MPKLSEQALSECRKELLAACRLPIDPQVLEEFLKKFIGNLENTLDHDPAKGSTWWSQIGQKVRDNGRFIGTFAEFLAKDKSSQAVEMHELMVALIMVRATCGVKRGPRFVPFYEVCERISGDPQVTRAFTEFLATAGLSTVTLEEQLR